MTEHCNPDVLLRLFIKPFMFPVVHIANEVPHFWIWRNNIILFKFDLNSQKFAILNSTPKYCCSILLAIVLEKVRNFLWQLECNPSPLQGKLCIFLLGFGNKARSRFADLFPCPQSRTKNLGYFLENTIMSSFSTADVIANGSLLFDCLSVIKKEFRNGRRIQCVAVVWNDAACLCFSQIEKLVFVRFSYDSGPFCVLKTVY